jgi:hypothetical protein
MEEACAGRRAHKGTDISTWKHTKILFSKLPDVFGALRVLFDAWQAAAEHMQNAAAYALHQSDSSTTTAAAVSRP